MAAPPTPYLKLGRGGAGNYHSSTTPPLQHGPNSSLSPAGDIESQPPPQPVLAAAKGEQAAAPAEYAHSGRGGAGNWYSPRELDATGTFAPTVPSSSSSAAAALAAALAALGTAADASSSSAATNIDDGMVGFRPAAAPGAAASSVPRGAGPTYYGRGGAGNFNARGVEEEGERERERERRREAIGEMARREVERGLRRPEGAYLRGGGGRAVEVGDV